MTLSESNKKLNLQSSFVDQLYKTTFCITCAFDLVLFPAIHGTSLTYGRVVIALTIPLNLLVISRHPIIIVN